MRVAMGSYKWRTACENLGGSPGNTERKCQGLAPHQLVTEKTTFPLGIGAMRYRIQDTMIEYSLIMVH